MRDLETLLLLLPQLAAVDVTSMAVVDGTLVIAAATRIGAAPCTCDCRLWLSRWSARGNVALYTAAQQ
ncbi:hypothetical protein KDL01_03010 [Actinospica durhamensis]|uniref:Uncharacterized protein n=1 Tax=Actinospica durhamensis TaxID=1508375 RepID=A0A941IRE4_9ACTN|nr:hypothetical protein [Actinospica durhamensis]MBR7832211.1 hypothetical protein [Actinospica durhamensis]